ncbi:murein biosynthesis integral membrane protein MurJ [Corynebacterium nuruki]|uniref:murein biosynthesis integral membrane protein MurJ n=1 Tax=Corynebacterium nuruki TaxID=1032851 RepID=UPI002FE2E6B4
MGRVTDSPEDSGKDAGADSDRQDPSGQRGRFRATSSPSRTRQDPAEVADRAGRAGTTGAAGRRAADATQAAENAVGRSTGTASGTASGTGTDGAPHDAQHASDTDVVRASGTMAIATLLSRVTGFLRTVFIGSALGLGVASAFNTANTLPNLITELVMGAVLTSLVVPLLVRAEKEDPDRGAAFIRRLFTLTFTLMMTVTVLSVFAAPLLTRMSLESDGKVNVGMSTSFAYLVLPQIVFYAMFSVMMGVLNTKGVFKPGAWAPVVNNVVTLAILGFYMLLPQDSKLQPTDSVTITDPHILLLGLGTTAGVVAQALIMVPYLKKAGIDLRPLWGLDDRIKQMGGMALAIVVYVAISQVGFILNNRIASGADDGAPTIYTQAWQLLQMPYGIVGVTLLTAVMPRLSRNAAEGDDRAVVKDLSMAGRLTMLVMVPVIVYMTAFGTVIAPALFAYKDYSLDAANVLGWTISFSAFTLIPYSLVLLHLRVFYAREEAWTPTFIIGGITVTKLVLAYLAPHIASEPRLVVVLLGAANGMGFVAGAIIGHRLLKRSLGHLGMRSVAHTALWALGASVVAALIAWRVDALLTRFVFPGTSSIGFIVRLLVTGVVFVILAALILSRSKLAEVMTIGATLARLPLIGGLFRGAARAVAERPEDELPSTKITAVDLGDVGAVFSPTGMVGTLPPLSAGRVRGPRLVPGAPILQGRFRLLADHGGSPAARLWQARDNSTGELVAVTVLDPQLAGVTSAELTSANARLADVHSPAIARVHEICDAHTMVAVVADWTDGAALTRVAESTPDPTAAGYAMVGLAEAAATAEDAGTSLGIDHRNRLRISTDGHAVLAFPGILPGGSPQQDVHALGVSLSLLLSGVPDEEIPDNLRLLTRAAKSAESITAAELAGRLRAVTAPDTLIAADADVAPDPATRPGFGAAPEKRSRAFIGGVATIVGVLLVVAVIATVIAVLGGGRKDSPLTTDSIRGNDGLGEIAVTRPTDVTEWAPADGRGTPDNPDLAGLTIDGDPATVWETSQYQAQFGPGTDAVKTGIGLLVSLPQATALSVVDLTGMKPGTTVELRIGSGDVTSLDQTRVVATGTAGSDHMSLTADGKTDGSAPADGEKGSRRLLSEPGDRVLLWITGLPLPDAATVGEITVHGAPVVSQQSSTTATPETPGTPETGAQGMPDSAGAGNTRGTGDPTAVPAPAL